MLHNEARVYSPKDTAVSTPNSDTPYSFVQPGWSGDTPAGIGKVLRSETEFAFTIFRTQLFEPSDLANVEKVQAGYSVAPLSQHVGKTAPAPSSAINWPAADAQMFGTDFPKYLNFLLQFTPESAIPEPERGLRERFAKIDIGPGEPYDFSKLSAEHQAALTDAIKAATTRIAATAEHVGTTIDGWQIGAVAGSREFFGGNWALRAAGAKLGIYGNDANEATYPFTRNDVNGVPLDGSQHAYTLTFPADAMPPVNAFWLVTMYDGTTQLLIDNPIDRYLINSPMLPELKKNSDSSLTIYVQHRSPGKEKEANWLPPRRADVRGDAALLAEGRGAFGVASGRRYLGPARHRPGQQRPRPGRDTLRRQVARDRHPHRPALWRRPVLPGAGWPYWNRLEYPKPIQNPNLWPGMQSTYFLSRLANLTAEARNAVSHGHILSVMSVLATGERPWARKLHLSDP